MVSNRLILTGFMGVGKSTVGPKAAEILDTNYYDTDEWMTAQGIDIPRLVRTDLRAFRELEAGALTEIVGLEPGIVSTGGGIVSTEVGRNALLAANVPVIWLLATFDESAWRVSKDTTGRERPLFDDRSRALALFNERLRLYAETADHVVDAGQSVELVVDDVVTIAKGE